MNSIISLCIALKYLFLFVCYSKGTRAHIFGSVFVFLKNEKRKREEKKKKKNASAPKPAANRRRRRRRRTTKRALERSRQILRALYRHISVSYF